MLRSVKYGWTPAAEDKLREVLREDLNSDDFDRINPTYQYLLKLGIDCVVNPERERNHLSSLDWRKLHEIDDGDYQGTLVFLCPIDTYQPGVYEYYITYVNYGSCSGCDTLLGILSDYFCADSEEDKEIILADLLLLILHMLQKLRPLYPAEEWANDSDFIEE